MGEIVSIKCTKCGNTVEIYQGVGEMWKKFGIDAFYPRKKGCNLNFYYKLDKKVIKEIHKFIEESKNAEVVDGSLEPYVCKNCGKIENKLYFEIKGDNKTYLPSYNCTCGGEYKLFNLDKNETLYCNKCGNEMIWTNIGIWD